MTLTLFNAPVVGLSFIATDNAHLVAISPKPGDRLHLAHEPRPADLGAVVVRNASGTKLGCLHQATAIPVAMMLTAGCRLFATCKCAPQGARLVFRVNIRLVAAPGMPFQVARPQPRLQPQQQQQPPQSHQQPPSQLQSQLQSQLPSSPQPKTQPSSPVMSPCEGAQARGVKRARVNL
jgi:hypothetical protein